MTGVFLFISLALPAACGTVLVFYLLKDEAGGLLERLLLGFGLGMGLLALEMFLLGIARVRFSFASIAILQVVAAAPFAALSLRGRGAPGNATSGAGGGGAMPLVLKAATAVLAVWVAGKFVFVFYEALMRPLLSNDTWMHWSAGAKFFYYSGGLSLEEGSDFFFGRGYRLYAGHPLLTPLAQVWIANAIGSFHEAFVKAWAPVYYACAVGLVFTAVRSRGGLFRGALAAFFLSSAPLLTFHATEGYADMVLGYYVLGGGLMLWRHMRSGGSGPLVLSGLFFSIAAFTKNEGLIYAAAAGAALALYTIFEKKRGWPLLGYAASFAAYILAWVIFKAYYGIGYGHAAASAGLTWERELHPEVIPIYFFRLFLSVDHGLIFVFLLAAAASTGLRRLAGGLEKYLLFIVLSAMGAFLFLYTTTLDYAAVTLGTGLHRNALGFVPLLYLAGALLAVRLLGAEPSKPPGSIT